VQFNNYNNSKEVTMVYKMF